MKVCHCCRKQFFWLLFGRHCMPCYRAHDLATLLRASRDFLHPPDPLTQALSDAGMRSKKVNAKRREGRGDRPPRGPS